MAAGEEGGAVRANPVDLLSSSENETYLVWLWLTWVVDTVRAFGTATNPVRPVTWVNEAFIGWTWLSWMAEYVVAADSECGIAAATSDRGLTAATSARGLTN